ncbi:MAG: ribonuclease III [Clostridia bacterium]|nr:ribonuclease III [Clostridia bacterium]
MKNTNIDKLQRDIGYKFKDDSLLKLAVTHSSYAYELRQKKVNCESNERLEFLGDSVVSIISTSYLYKKYPALPEGELSRLRAGAICTASLSSFARGISLGSYLLLGCGEDKGGGRENPTILENAFEALIGAMYLDSGCDIETVAGFLLPLLEREIGSAISSGATDDCKSKLQQIVQQMPDQILTYVQTDRRGPDNAPIFTVEARLNSNVIGKGTGTSKRRAEQAAAKEALGFFGK